MDFHDVANIFPMMGDDEYRALVADIKANGLHQPIWTYQGKIIDGRNRYKACQEAGIEPQFREWDGQGSLVAFVVSLNLNRRHLTSSQKAMVAIEVEKCLAEENKVGRPTKDSEKDGNISGISGESRAQAAAIVGTNSHYVTDAKKIVAKAPELKEAVLTGRLNIPDAKQVARFPEEQRKEIIEKLGSTVAREGKTSKVSDVMQEVKQEACRKTRQEAGRWLGSSGKAEVHVYKPHDLYKYIDCTLYKGDIEVLQEKIEPASIDAIITQPSNPSCVDYDRLGQFADYALKDGGSLIVVTNNDAVRKAYTSLDNYLTYHQTLSHLLYIARDKKDAYFSTYYSRTHKCVHSSILWYVKGHTSLSVDYQVIEEREYHRYEGLKYSGIYQLVEHLSKEGQLVCDPFDIDGLTFYASAMLNREYIGTSPDLRKGWEKVMLAHAHGSLAYLDGDETYNAYCEFCEMHHPPYRDKKQRDELVKATDYDSLPDDEISGIGKYVLCKYEELDPTSDCPYGGYVSLGFPREINMRIPDTGRMVIGENVKLGLSEE